MTIYSINHKKISIEQRTKLVELINAKIDLRKKELAWYVKHSTLIRNDIHNLKKVLEGRLPLRYLEVVQGNKYPTKKMA